jgi:hypothetical protein
LCDSPVAILEKLQSARVLQILLVVEAIDVFEIAIEREEELCAV